MLQFKLFFLILSDGTPILSFATDIRALGATLYFLPVQTRTPLKFGSETLSSVVCARVCLRVRDREGREAHGWGETPLSVQWVWPSDLPYQTRLETLQALCTKLASAWSEYEPLGHPLELGHDFARDVLSNLAHGFPGLPHLAALVCCSAFDIALHDAFGILHDVPVYETYNARWMNRDLSAFLEAAPGTCIDFRGQYPQNFLVEKRPDEIKAWHLVGGLDALDESELKGDEPRDAHPVTLRDWIARDGLKCLKVKLRGNDAGWDFERLRKVGQIAHETGVTWLSADFNCTVRDATYVTAILDRLRDHEPRIYGSLLYVEQPFPYDLEADRLDAHAMSARKPLFLDESAHDWRVVRLGRELGWSGVALKTCKTQSGALLSLCWARAHGMELMVQDLTNPMLAQIPHVLLGAHAGTIMGVETNAMQFYPEASLPEARVHGGIYRRCGGKIDLNSIRGAGFGYRIDEIERALPEAAAHF